MSQLPLAQNCQQQHPQPSAEPFHHYILSFLFLYYTWYAQAIKSLLSKPAVPYRTVRLTIVGQGRVGKTALVRGIRNGWCHD